MEKVGQQVYRRRVKLVGFIDHDRLRSGYVSKNQFHQVLRRLNVEVNQSDLDEIFSRFYNEQRGMVNYVLFRREIEKTCNQGAFFLEQDPDAQPETKCFRKKLTKQEEANDEYFDGLKKRMNYQRRVLGIVIRNVFGDFDKLNRGVVTPNQFRRAFPFKKVTPQELEFLVERYKTPEGIEVDYMLFNEELEKKEEGEEEGEYVTYRREETSGKRQTPDENVVMESFRRLVHEFRVNLKDCFGDFDNLKKGVITQKQFESVLGGIKFGRKRISEQEMKILGKNYTHITTDNRIIVDYRTFLLDLVDHGEIGRKMEKDPDVQVQSVSTIHESEVVLNPDEEKRFEKVMRKIVGRIKTRRILIVNIFNDFNKTDVGVKTRYLSPSRFTRCLDNLGLRLQQTDYDLLCKKFDTLRNKTVNYHEFVKMASFDEKNRFEEKDKYAKHLF